MVLGQWDQKPFGEMTVVFKASLTPSSSLLLKTDCSTAPQYHTTQSEQVTVQNNPKEIKDAKVSYSEELAQHNTWPCKAA